MTQNAKNLLQHKATRYPAAWEMFFPTSSLTPVIQCAQRSETIWRQYFERNKKAILWYGRHDIGRLTNEQALISGTLSIVHSCLRLRYTSWSPTPCYWCMYNPASFPQMKFLFSDHYKGHLHSDWFHICQSTGHSSSIQQEAFQSLGHKKLRSNFFPTLFHFIVLKNFLLFSDQLGTLGLICCRSCSSLPWLE